VKRLECAGRAKRPAEAGFRPPGTPGNRSRCPSQSGVALRLPPHSKPCRDIARSRPRALRRPSRDLARTRTPQVPWIVDQKTPVKWACERKNGGKVRESAGKNEKMKTVRPIPAQESKRPSRPFGRPLPNGHVQLREHLLLGQVSACLREVNSPFPPGSKPAIFSDAPGWAESLSVCPF